MATALETPATKTTMKTIMRNKNDKNNCKKRHRLKMLNMRKKGLVDQSGAHVSEYGVRIIRRTRR